VSGERFHTRRPNKEITWGKNIEKRASDAWNSEAQRNKSPCRHRGENHRRPQKTEHLMAHLLSLSLTSLFPLSFLLPLSHYSSRTNANCSSHTTRACKSGNVTLLRPQVMCLRVNIVVLIIRSVTKSVCVCA